MRKLSREHSFYAFDATNDFVMVVDQDEHFLVETYDARRGRLQRHDQLLSSAPNWADENPKANPCTGPIAVKGLVPGDTARVEVHNIELENRGFIIHKTDMGICKQLVDETFVVFGDVKNGEIALECGLTLPIRPHIGTLGVTPHKTSFPTAFASTHGGNIDCRFLEPSTALYLPIFIEQGGLGLGDVHARMGSGELMGTGVEICATVELSVSSTENIKINGPVLCTNDHVMTIASADHLQEALEIASCDMVDLLCRYGGFSKMSALCLLTTICDAQICQSFDSSIFSVASVAIDRNYLKAFKPIERTVG